VNLLMVLTNAMFFYIYILHDKNIKHADIFEKDLLTAVITSYHSVEKHNMLMELSLSLHILINRTTDIHIFHLLLAPFFSKIDLWNIWT
jgi:hypothetical protein